MEKEKSPHHGAGGGLSPPFGRCSPCPPVANFFIVKHEPSPLPPLMAMKESSQVGEFSHDIIGMPDLPPKKCGHRRAHSDILDLPEEICFDSDLGADGQSLFDEIDDDFFFSYIDMEKFESSYATSDLHAGETSTRTMPHTLPPNDCMTTGPSDKPRIRHQHSMSMDGSTLIKPEMLISGMEGASVNETKKALSAAKLADLALIDPKRAKRIWANRQSAARSKEKKMRYISELERKVQTRQAEAKTLYAQLTMLERDTNDMTAENKELKRRLQTIEQHVNLQDVLNDAMKKEVQRLKLATGLAIPNGGHMMNYGSGFDGSQQFYAYINAMHTLNAAHQFQQRQIHPQQQYCHQHQQQQRQQQPSHIKIKGPLQWNHM